MKHGVNEIPSAGTSAIFAMDGDGEADMPARVRIRWRDPWWIACNFEEIISCAGLVLILLVVSFNVALRYLFSASIAWAEEVAVLGFSCVIFIGSAAVYKRNMHVGIDFLVNLLPEKMQRALAIVTKMLMLCITAYVTHLGWIYSFEAWDKPTSILQFPYFFINLPICIGFASMTWYSARDCWRMVTGWRPAKGDGK